MFKKIILALMFVFLVTTLSHTEATSSMMYSPSLRIFGDSIAMGYSATNRETLGFGGLIASDIGYSQINRAVSGAGACDTNNNQIFPNENPSATNSPMFIVMAGNNDGFYKGLSYQANFKLCQTASIAWLAIPSQYKVMGQNATGTTHWSSSGISGGVVSSKAGSDIIFPITTYGGPVYLWYRVADGNNGLFNYSIDGLSASVANYVSPQIATGIGNTQGYGVVRIPVSSGKHTLTVTVVGGTVEILGVGVVPHITHDNSIKVYVAGVTRRQGDEEAVYNTNSYDIFNREIVDTLQADGLPVYFVDTRSHINPDTDLADVVHTSDVGHSKLRDIFERSMLKSMLMRR